MLQLYVLDNPSKWEDYLYLVDFSYNNSYQESLKMSPFESLYGRKCGVLVKWEKPMDRLVVGMEMLQEMEQHAKEKHIESSKLGSIFF